MFGKTLKRKGFGKADNTVKKFAADAESSRVLSARPKKNGKQELRDAVVVLNTEKKAREADIGQAVAARAWEIWQSEGCPANKDVEHWLAAESELRGKAIRH